MIQEDIESSASPDSINFKSTEIKQNFSKLDIFSLIHWLTLRLDHFLKGEDMN